MAKTDRKTFKWEDEETGVSIVAPPIGSIITAGFLRKHRKDDIMEQMMAAIELALDKQNLAVFDGLSVEKLGEFYTAWQEDSGITLGE